MGHLRCLYALRAATAAPLHPSGGRRCRCAFQAASVSPNRFFLQAGIPSHIHDQIRAQIRKIAKGKALRFVVLVGDADPAMKGRYGILAYDNWNIFHLCLTAGIDPFKVKTDDEVAKFEETTRRIVNGAKLITDDFVQINLAMLNGEIDFILKCVAPDLSSFQSFLTGQLLTTPNVESVKTSLVIRGAKDDPGVPFDVLEARLSTAP